jgi:HD-like signal output (HDOD) protein/tRNA A-37 threonylcarbamoyl transferase component Bud32
VALARAAGHSTARPAATGGGEGTASAEGGDGGGEGDDEVILTATHMTVGDYKVTRRLGEGGMGVVYEGVHQVIGRRVAIKLLRPELAKDPRFAPQILSEARLVNAIRHRGIVDIYDVGQLGGGHWYLVMELLEGDTLEAHLQRCGKLAVSEGLSVLDEILDALEAVHAAGVVHRDLKPSNVFRVVPPTGPPYLKLLDFGVALGPVTGGEAAPLAGTPAYIAPEQFFGAPASVLTDLFAEGVLAYELLTGELPFPGETDDIVRGQVKGPPRAPLALMPIELRQLILALMARNPAARPQSVKAVRQVLRELRQKPVAPTHTLKPRPVVQAVRVQPLAPVRQNGVITEAMLLARRWLGGLPVVVASPEPATISNAAPAHPAAAPFPAPRGVPPGVPPLGAADRSGALRPTSPSPVGLAGPTGALVAPPRVPARTIAISLADIEAVERANWPPVDVARLERLSMTAMAVSRTAGRVLPPFPVSALRVVQRVQRPNLEVPELVRLVMQDPSLTASVMRRANSAYSARGIEIESVRLAVARLGVREVSNVVTAAATSALFNQSLRDTGPVFVAAQRRIWLQSLATGFSAGWLAMEYRLGDSERAFMGGVLHDLGQVAALDSLSEPELARQLTGPSAEAELAMLVEGLHVEMGARMAPEWSLPSYLVQICAEHHSPLPGPEPKTELHVVRMTSAMVEMRINPCYPTTRFAELRDSAQVLGLDRFQVRAAVAQVHAFVKVAERLISS